MRNWYEIYFAKTRTQVMLPPAPLRPYIKKYLIYENREGQRINQALRPLPNGYTEVFMHLKGSQICFPEKEVSLKLSCFIAGIYELNYPLKVKAYSPSPIFKGISITFTPRGVSRLLSTEVGELTNKIYKLDDLLGPSAGELLEELETATSDNQRIKALNFFFQQRLNKSGHQDEEEIYHFTDILLSRNRPMSIDELAGHTNHSYKSLYRLFLHHMGLCPKMYLRIIRFNRACSILNSHPGINWSELIHQCGYYDQSHFIKEFRAIMNESPHHFLSTTGGHFYLNRAYTFA